MVRFGRKSPHQPEGRRRLRVNEQPARAAFSYYGQERRTDTSRQNSAREMGRSSKSENKQITLKFITERIGLVILLLAIVAGTINSLSLSTRVHIVPLGDNPTFLHDTSTYETSASSILAGSIWNRNKLTINTNNVGKQLQQRFPELADVSITLPFIAHQAVIYIQPSRPVLILNTLTGAYVIGENGIALLMTTQLPANSKLDLPVATDQAGLKIKAGQQALTSNDVAIIQMVLGQLAAAKIPVAGLSLPPAASELDLHVQGQPYYVKFNLHASVDDARQQAGTFIAVQQHLAAQHATPSQYIDVRVDGRAYYQ